MDNYIITLATYLILMVVIKIFYHYKLEVRE